MANVSTTDVRKQPIVHVIAPWLATKLVQDLTPPKGVVICVAASDTLAEAYKTLIQHNIQSAPVYDFKQQKYTALVDIGDILSATLLLHPQQNSGQKFAEVLLRYLRDETKPDPDVSKLLSTENLFKNITVQDIANLSDRNPFVPLPVGSSLFDCVKLMCERGLHRVPIIGKDGRLANLISQSNILNYLWENRFVWENEIGHQSMTQLNLHNISAEAHAKLGHPLLSIRENKQALDAFQLMHEKKVSGLPVVDEDGKLLANISVQDLKEIGHDASRINTLQELVMQYLKHAHAPQHRWRLFSSERTVHYLGDEHFYDMMSKMVSHRVHRIYYVDKHKKLFGIVTMSDILRFFVAH